MKDLCFRSCLISDQYIEPICMNYISLYLRTFLIEFFRINRNIAVVCWTASRPFISLFPGRSSVWPSDVMQVGADILVWGKGRDGSQSSSMQETAILLASASTFNFVELRAPRVLLIKTDNLQASNITKPYCEQQAKNNRSWASVTFLSFAN